MSLAERAQPKVGNRDIVVRSGSQARCGLDWAGMDIFSYLIPAALVAVTAVLGFGIYALFRGGDFGRSYSNKLMRLRVVMQAVAIAVLMAAVWWRTRH